MTLCLTWKAADGRKPCALYSNDFKDPTEVSLADTNRIGVLWLARAAVLALVLMPFQPDRAQAAPNTLVTAPAPSVAISTTEGVRSQTITQTSQPVAPSPEPSASTAPRPAPPTIAPRPVVMTAETPARPVRRQAPVYLPAPSSDGGNASIVARAEQEIGRPYVWGGESPATGFDCSGLVHYAYGARASRLSREAGEMYGQVQRTAAPAPGDIVFFGRGRVIHVGIYVGNGAVVHASTPRTGVRLDSLASLSQALGYLGSGRV